RRGRQVTQGSDPDGGGRGECRRAGGGRGAVHRGEPVGQPQPGDDAERRPQGEEGARGRARRRGGRAGRGSSRGHGGPLITVRRPVVWVDLSRMGGGFGRGNAVAGILGNLAEWTPATRPARRCRARPKSRCRAEYQGATVAASWPDAGR